MKNLFLVCITALFSVFAITACGQKGPLYLPGNPSEVRSEVPRQNQPHEEEDEESEQEKPE